METYQEAQVKQNLETVEILIDETTLCKHVEILSMICTEKAEHIRAGYQDERFAKKWERAARLFNTLQSRIAGL